VSRETFLPKKLKKIKGDKKNHGKRKNKRNLGRRQQDLHKRRLGTSSQSINRSEETSRIKPRNKPSNNRESNGNDNKSKSNNKRKHDPNMNYNLKKVECQYCGMKTELPQGTALYLCPDCNRELQKEPKRDKNQRYFK